MSLQKDEILTYHFTTTLQLINSLTRSLTVDAAYYSPPLVSFVLLSTDIVLCTSLACACCLDLHVQDLSCRNKYLIIHYVDLLYFQV